MPGNSSPKAGPGPSLRKRSPMAVAMRPLGVLERLFHLHGKRANTHFCMAARFHGAADERGIRSSIAMVVRRHPLLGAEIGAGADGLLSFLQASGPPSISFHGSPVTGASVDAAMELSIIAGELARPMGSPGEPTFRCAASIGVDAFSIVLTFHHAVADGRSGARVIGDLSAALGGAKLDGPALPLALETYADPFGRRLGTGDASDAIPGEPRRLNTEAPRISRRVLDAATTTALLSACRRRSCTLHGALVAALAAASFRTTRTVALRVLSPVDLRMAIGAPEGICALLVGAVATMVERGDDFWSVAGSTSKACAAVRDPTDIRERLEQLSAKLPHDVGADAVTSFYQDEFDSDLLVSNLGPFAIERRDAGFRLMGISGPFLSPFEGRRSAVGVVGFQGALHLVQTCPSGGACVLDEAIDMLRTHAE